MTIIKLSSIIMFNQLRSGGQLYNYEEKSEEFPQFASNIESVQSPFPQKHNLNIGRILSKYRNKNKDSGDTSQNNSFQFNSQYDHASNMNRSSKNTTNRSTPRANFNKDIGFIGRSKPHDFQKKNVHAGIALNYSEIYENLKLGHNQDHNMTNIVPKIHREQTGQFGETPNNAQEEYENKRRAKERVSSVDIYKKPYLKNPIKDQSAKNELSMKSSTQINSNKKNLPGIIVGNVRNSGQLSGSEAVIGYKPLPPNVRSRPSKEQSSEYQSEPRLQNQVSFNYQFNLQENYKQEPKANEREQASNKNIRVKVLNDKQSYPSDYMEKVQSKEKAPKRVGNGNETISEEQVLGKSRSIGVGNYIVEYKDINESYHSESSQKEKVSKKINQSPKQREYGASPKKDERVTGFIVTRSPRNSIQQPEYGKQQNMHENSSNADISPDIIVHYEKPETLQNRSHVKQKNNSHVFSTIKQKNEEKEQSLDHEDLSRHNPKNSKANITRVSHILQQMNDEERKQQVISHCQPEEEHNKSQNLPQQIKQNKQSYLEQNELLTSEKNIPEESPQQQHPQNQLDFIHPTFDVQQYAEIYPQLKLIHDSLKQSLVNIQQVLRSMKKYLEIISSGNMDNLDEIILPLNKKKSIKTALFYERATIILIGFAYVHGSIKEYHRYLLNAVGYVMTNCMIMLKVFEETKQKSSDPSQQQNIKMSSRVSGIGYGYASRANTINQVIRKSDRLAMKRNLDGLRNNNDVIFDTIMKIAKHEETFLESIKPIIKQGQRQPLQSSFYNLLESFSFYLCSNNLDELLPFLSVCPNPYLPTFLPPETKYTLIVDPVQLFCPVSSQTSKLQKRQHKGHGNYQSFRPFKDHFLSEMQQYYEIIFWSNMFPKDVEKVMNLIDTKQINHHRLYRHHGIKKDKNTIIKCVDRLSNLDPSTIIMLDDQFSSGKGSLDHCIHIPEWRGNKNDTILAEICPLLAMIVIKRMSTLEAVAKVRDQTSKNKREGVKYINFGINFD